MAFNKNEISVELRLLLDKLKSDVQKAASTIKSGLSSTVGGQTAVPVEKTAAAFDKVAASAKKSTAAVKAHKEAMMAAWRASVPPPNVTIPDENQKKPTGPAGPGAIVPRGGYGLATPPPGLGGKPPFPVPPIIPPPFPTTPAAQPGNTIASLFAKVINSPLGKVGTVVTTVAAALASLRVAIGLVKFALQAVIVPLRMLSNLMMRAAEQGRAMYAKTLQSGGLPMGFVAHRSALSEILGVGEREVYNYGRAVAFVTDKVRWSARVTTETTPKLASLAYEWRALQMDLRAVEALIATELAPMIRQMIASLRAFVETAARPLVDLLGEQLTLALQLAAAGVQQLIQQLYPLIFVSKLFAKGTPKPGGGAPAPAVSTDRLMASAWERMGLVIGGAGGQNWSRDTAKNTRRSADLLAALVEKVAALKGQPTAQGAIFTGR